MVLTRKVGTERSFGVVVLLYVVTFGLYGIYWHYKAQNEVFRQFELDREDHDEGAVWLLFAYAVFRPLLWVFLYTFQANLNAVRRRLGLRERPGAGGFMALVVVGYALLWIAALLLFIASSIPVEEEPGPDGADGTVDVASLGIAGTLLAVALLLALVATPFLLSAYGSLQASLNEVWRAYDARMAQLRPPTPTLGLTPWPGAGSAGAGGAPPGPPAPPGWDPVR